MCLVVDDDNNDDDEGGQGKEQAQEPEQQQEQGFFSPIPLPISPPSILPSTPRGWSGWSGGRAGPQGRRLPPLGCLGILTEGGGDADVIGLGLRGGVLSLLRTKHTQDQGQANAYVHACAVLFYLRVGMRA